ncbi:phosphatase PAP2 family protein [Yeosuana sp.]|uniref:phosphatase PAP2 family protein n=1 Tax=Yeosuana sp. TaxID=2529388 RepID=UPI004054C807|tara:strand:- start:4991 stop:5554 length:564 start_codon:yes stop_codon:yes gene_type:complete
MIDHLIEYDKALFLFLNNLGSPTWDGFWLIITNKLTFIPLYVALLYLLYKKYGLKSLLILVVVIALMITFTDQVTNIFKRTFERPRPCGDEYILKHMRFVASYCGKYGYFSGHASNTMATAVFAGLLLRPYYKNLIFILLLWSAVVAYSRIYVGVHYPLDIVSGLTFGALSGFMFYKLAKYLIHKFA